jgi:Ni,Fe-hydrogenase III small subunit/NAD-dependent dihydropyrimidine dehydrogenase PreA subunit
MHNLFKTISVRKAQGSQFIPDLTTAVPGGFRGKPTISAAPCASDCTACQTACPSGAIALAPVRIDLGRCVLCGDCEAACAGDKIGFTSDAKLSAASRDALTVSADHPDIDPIKVSQALRRRFGRSLKLRSVSAGGCNGCEMEINAWGNVNFDLGRYGIDLVASPRHADGLVLSGPITRNMASALQTCWDSMPEPKLVIAVGACAISGGVFAGCEEVDRSFLEAFKPTLYAPGCPTHPLTFINGIMGLLGITG